MEKLRFLGRFQDWSQSASMSELERTYQDSSVRFLASVAERVASKVRVPWECLTYLQAKEMLYAAFRRQKAWNPSMVWEWQPQHNPCPLFWLQEPDKRRSLVRQAVEMRCGQRQHLERVSPLFPSSILTVSPSIRCEEGVLFHPQEDSWEWIVFDPCEAIAGELRGTWSKHDKILMGFVKRDTIGEARSKRHPADVGYFLSLGSLTAMGPDGTNFSLDGLGTVEDVWMKQLVAEARAEGRGQGLPLPFYDMWQNYQLLLDLNFKSMKEAPRLQYCLKLTQDLEVHVWVKRLASSSADFWPQSWIALGRIRWRGGTRLPEGDWCPTVVFPPRRSMGPPQCALTPPQGVGALPSSSFRPGSLKPSIRERFDSSPGLKLVPADGAFLDAPKYINGEIIWPQYFHKDDEDLVERCRWCVEGAMEWGYM